jgi:hypothetical protein
MFAERFADPSPRYLHIDTDPVAAEGLSLRHPASKFAELGHDHVPTRRQRKIAAALHMRIEGIDSAQNRVVDR